ncbi:hypothetical protein [Acinetobacter sp. Marseille-P8610]|uniref:hypothetical protein n=1 Tax=Acinetobacter sp. Marseille-P8610 TaxID=2864459 RepID=UPI001CE3F967|nr:hypothetical protein [Acinetobacter sp. Marseille-P8610]
MKTLKITWLDSCPKCGFGEYANVKTERGIGCFLFSGDIVNCPECNHEGEIGCDEDFAYVKWDEVEEAKADAEDK